MIRTDHSEHQVLATVETVGFRGTFAVRPWVGIDELQVAIEDLTKELSRAVAVAFDVDEWDVSLDEDLEADRNRLVTDGGGDLRAAEHGYAPDRRNIDDISAIDECPSCSWSPAAIILVDGDWECFNCGHDPEFERDRLVTDGGARMAPAIEGVRDELLRVPDRFRRGGVVEGKPLKRARVVDIETGHPGPDRQVLELHTEDGFAYRYQRFDKAEKFRWFHWQKPDWDPNRHHGKVPNPVQVYVKLVNREGLDRFREDVRTIPALDPDESQEVRSDGGRKIRRQVDKLRAAIRSSADSPSVVELSLRDALEASEDPEVNYHIRQALQHLAVRERDREGGSR